MTYQPTDADRVVETALTSARYVLPYVLGVDNEAVVAAYGSRFSGARLVRLSGAGPQHQHDHYLDAVILLVASDVSDVTSAMAGALAEALSDPVVRHEVEGRGTEATVGFVINEVSTLVLWKHGVVFAAEAITDLDPARLTDALPVNLTS